MYFTGKRLHSDVILRSSLSSFTRRHRETQRRVYTVLSAGEGFLGCLGSGTFEAQHEQFLPVTGLPHPTITKVASGWAHSAAVTEAGAVFVWGRPFDLKNVLRLNNMHTASSIMAKLANAFSSPKEVFLVPELCFESGAKDVACSAGLTAIVTDSGEVFCFGQNRWGQCGTPSRRNDQDRVHVYTPSKVQDLDHACIKTVSLGFQHALALAEDGALFAWGKGERGQLGDGNNEIREQPVQVRVGNDLGVSAISAGFNHSAALTENGELYIWGKSQSTELKAEKKVAQVDVYHDQLSPRHVPLKSKACEVHCSSFQTTVRLENGEIWALGNAHDSRSCMSHPVPVQLDERMKSWVLKGCIHDTILFHSSLKEKTILALRLGNRNGEFTPFPKYGECFDCLETSDIQSCDISLGWKHALLLL